LIATCDSIDSIDRATGRTRAKRALRVGAHGVAPGARIK